jgi:peptidoglycan/xylan/chitin deacetylase (PgdA/CDA1 family)
VVSRRRLLRGGAIAAGGAIAGAAAVKTRLPFEPNRLPLDGGYAPAGDPVAWTLRGQVRAVWHVPNEASAVALTFDDGPTPQWTPRVLDTLAKLAVPATFFLVGSRLHQHIQLIGAARYDGHEVANHTWSHADLARLDETSALDEVRRCHDEVAAVLGRAPRLLRPPWGHVGGTTLLAADALGYDVVLWSLRMPERDFRSNPTGIVGRVVDQARPGTIMLAHDTGNPDRLITIDNLPAIVKGLRAKGLRLVTVAELLTLS